MANEIQIDLSLDFAKNTAKTQRQESFKVDVGGNAYHQRIQVVAAAREDIMDNSDINDIGYFYLKLLSAPTSTTTISFGHDDSTAYAGKLAIGESALLKGRGGIATLFVIASAAENAEVEYLIIEA